MKDNKIYIYVLGTLLVLSLFFIYYNHKKDKELQEILRNDLTSQLDSLKLNYNNVSTQNEELEKRMSHANDSLTLLKKKIAKLQIGAKELKELRSTVLKMKQQQQDLIKTVDSLRATNKILLEQRDLAEGALKVQTALSEKLSDEKKELEMSVDKASLMEIKDVKIEGVSVSSSGKIDITNRASSSDKIRTCFTIVKNKVAKKGNKDFFVRILSPNNKLITELKSNNQFTAQDKVMNFSAKISVNYENDELEACIYVGKNDELEKGIYRVFVYTENRLLVETELLLK